jgi:hypothetical protein
MAKKQVTKGVETFDVEIVSNGFVLNYSGKDAEDDWTSTKEIVNTVEQLHQRIDKIIEEMS